ncbi:sigma-70 family RNA polymerase sigma factor [Acinetobacter sp. NIPH 2699]|uniref:sigma-70 family RNA polymerase sigma factor n=1 Tax=Acinetobacter sp. NIPH 2699 TaxID=2923433 RepID=UPI001F4BB0FA|nr:sigma-70 family RNA polymerase sigma factor [Acinetobacter sp. NIPH 2699]MCH7337070.1 sigma-70 family RNA polymerase sigma factor [Acinetobacter sp. NIPH 2699]
MNVSSPLPAPRETHQSFKKIYEDNYQWLKSWLYRNCTSSVALEDLAQDTFLKLFISNKAHLIREPKAYLTTVARGLAIDQTRHEIIERKYLEYLQESLDGEVQYSPEQIMSCVQLLNSISVAISGLPERQRVSLLLYYLEGINQADIAKRFNVSIRTIQHDLVKAMVHCHVWIQQHL